MADEKKKQLYGGSYDEQIRDTAQQIQNRPAFSYDLDGDALYQQYKDRYTQNAKLGMKDTMGQAAALTGGYGNSYAQGVGQQRYDETMRGLTDMIPTLEQSAYQRWRDRGADLQNRYSMLSSMAATEQATGQQNYAQLAQLIGSSGYKPTEEELANAGMSADQANAMLQMWIASNPQLAYNNGQISAEDFYKMTGTYPIGYTAPGGGGVNWWEIDNRNTKDDPNSETPNSTGNKTYAAWSAWDAAGDLPQEAARDFLRAETDASDDEITEWLESRNKKRPGGRTRN